jgi:hypothetical protein
MSSVDANLKSGRRFESGRWSESILFTTVYVVKYTGIKIHQK